MFYETLCQWVFLLEKISKKIPLRKTGLFITYRMYDKPFIDTKGF